ncbi:MAG: alpha/beta fold hydrolase [Akkermansia sp.]|nr:alpha/beta fold hydrolase [Akkermansia sp.]
MQRNRLSYLLAGCCLLGSCSQPQVAEGIDPAPRTGPIERRTQEPLPARPAELAFIFVGGFAEPVLLQFRSIYEQTPPLPCKGRQLRAYYAWESGTGNLLFHSTWKLQRDLRAFLAVNPAADVVLVGHSYGGSAIMDALRGVADVPHSGKVLVLTVDPVSRRERSKPRERAPQVDFWINSYCYPYRNVRDVAARLGGPWRECPQADVNIRFSALQRDAAGKRYAHVYPEPLLMEPAPGQEKSAYQHLLEACGRLGIGGGKP